MEGSVIIVHLDIISISLHVLMLCWELNKRSQMRLNEPGSRAQRFACLVPRLPVTSALLDPHDTDKDDAAQRVHDRARMQTHQHLCQKPIPLTAVPLTASQELP